MPEKERGLVCLTVIRGEYKSQYNTLNNTTDYHQHIIVQHSSIHARTHTHKHMFNRVNKELYLFSDI